MTAKNFDIAPAQPNTSKYFGRTIETNKIIKSILYADKRNSSYTKEFSKQFEGLSPLEVSSKIWQLLKEEIQYKADKAGYQITKSPASFWETKTGDCKSYSNFTSSILKNLGIPHKYRFTGYSGNRVTHVYVVIPPTYSQTGKEIIIDGVWDYFNSEKPYKFKKEYTANMEKGIHYIGKIEASKFGEPQKQFTTDPLIRPAYPVFDKVKNPRITRPATPTPILTRPTDPFFNRTQYPTDKKGTGMPDPRLIRPASQTITTQATTQATTPTKSTGTTLNRDEVRAFFGFKPSHLEIEAGEVDPLLLVDNEFDLLLERDKAADNFKIANANNAPAQALKAFGYHDAITEALDSPRISGLFSSIKKLGDKIGQGVKNLAGGVKDAVDNLGDTAVGQAFRKVRDKAIEGGKAVVKLYVKAITLPMRLAIKGILEMALPKAAPFFLYTHPAFEKVELTETGKRKKAKAKKIRDFIVSAIGMKPSHFEAIISRGYFKRFGNTIEEAAKGFTSPSINGVRISPLMQNLMQIHYTPIEGIGAIPPQAIMMGMQMLSGSGSGTGGGQDSQQQQAGGGQPSGGQPGGANAIEIFESVMKILDKLAVLFGKKTEEELTIEDLPNGDDFPLRNMGIDPFTDTASPEYLDGFRSDGYREENPLVNPTNHSKSKNALLLLGLGGVIFLATKK